MSGKDTSNFVQGQLDKWNQMHPDQKVTFIELPEDADAQRQQMIQNANAKSDAYSVLALDNVWTAEFAANRYVVQLPQDQFPNVAQFLPPVIDSAKYKGNLYGVPYASDGGLLYYRTDLLQAAGIAAPPKTWQELISDCEKIKGSPQGAGVNCYAGQFQKYEGLTVNAAEAINSAGGVITDAEGKPNVNTPEAKAGLDFLVNGFKQGYIAKEALTYKEEESRRAFQEGKLIFLRNWPYVYQLASKNDGSSQVAGKFGVAPLPGLNGPGVSSLGGHALAISTYAKNKKTAAGLHQLLHQQGDQHHAGHPGLAGSGVDRDLRRPDAAEAAAVPAHAQGVHPRRPAAAQGRPLRRRDPGDPGRGVRRPARHDDHGPGPATAAGQAHPAHVELIRHINTTDRTGRRVEPGPPPPPPRRV